ncbi:ABC transporter ATP-binding protein [Entomospira entomophila]|uniref:ABC transporter ATP-binding protein n=1 Tax=Entomospira entomophila TaxID=2719988 RepID=A0A968G8R9_9SPIO|nr:ABC transporter ATP-binding protein [Entomospira entomophilus]NIZ40647.1 ABC transporter ATP-binding protein [Entomospira entomophilus]WDI34861.1 ABC transporter ATP-binding protein [Entomospira entomophilus]
MSNPLLQVDHLNSFYSHKPQQSMQALYDISFSLYRHQNLGVIGESGSGKSTLVKSIAKLMPSQSQQILFNQQRIDHLTERQFKPLRQELQLIFQDPHSSLNPYITIQRSMMEPLEAFPTRIPRTQWIDQIQSLLDDVGLSASVLKKLPQELSGGMAQRVNIARSLLLHPQLILADEPISALDFIIQMQIIDLLQNLQTKHGVSFLIISHNMSIIKQLCEHLIILYQGRVVEYGLTKKLMNQPIHPYTKSLLVASNNPLSVNATNATASETFTLHGESFTFYPAQRNQPSILKEVAPKHWVTLYQI